MKGKDGNTCIFETLHQEKIRVWLSISSWMTYLFSFCSLLFKCFFLIFLEPRLEWKIADNHRIVLTEISFSSPKMDGNGRQLTWIQTLLDCGLRNLWIYGEISFCWGEGVFLGIFRQPQRRGRGGGGYLTIGDNNEILSR